MRVVRLLAGIATLICSALFLLPALPAQAQLAPSSDDLWDISQGSELTSPNFSGPFSSINDMWGAQEAQRNRGTAIFGMHNGIAYAEWRTATPVRVEQIALFADYNPAGTQSEGRHPFTNIKFFVRHTDGTFKEIYSFSPPIPYGGGINGTELAHAADIPVVEGQHFRVEITPSEEMVYARVIELDAFGEALPPLEIPDPSTEDLWDINQGTTITGHSEIHNNDSISFNIGDVFGQELTKFGSEKGNIIFQERLPKGTIHYIEWQTPEPITLERFHLFAYHDTFRLSGEPQFRDARYRGFSEFRLYSKEIGDTEWELLHEYTNTNPYRRDDGNSVAQGSNRFLHAADVTPTRAQQFRAEFVQYGDPDDTTTISNITGPRVVELDGFGEIATEPEPVVLVPGMVASLNIGKIFSDKDGGTWNFTPGARNFYQALIDRFEAAGLKENENLFIAHYDWRNPVADAATNYLKQTIDHAKQVTGRDQVDIVAHSMGGLVARAYIQGNQYANDVDQLVTLGTPNKGSADAYVAWEGGVLPDRWSAGLRFYLLNIENALRIHRAAPLLRPLSFRSFFPSLQDILPTENFVTKNGTLVLRQLHAAQNAFLTHLNSNTDIFTQSGGPSLHTIGSTNLATLAQVPVTTPTLLDSILNRWREGHATPDPPQTDSVAGDETVLLSNTHLGANTHTIEDAKHDKLPEEAQEKVLEILGLETEGEHISYAPPEDMLGVTVLSPVIPSITAPDGTTFTCDATKQEDNTACVIDETDPNGPKLIVITNPPPGTYTTTLTGTGSGSYHAITCFADETQDSCTTREGTTSPSKVETYKVKLGEETYQAPPQDVLELTKKVWLAIPRLLQERHINIQAGAPLTGPAGNMYTYANAYTQFANLLGFDHTITKNYYNLLKQSFEKFSQALEQQVNLNRLDTTAANELVSYQTQISGALK